MKKIMFNDRYGLTRAVIDGRKTMTRRVVSDNLQDKWDDYDDFCTSVNAGNFPTTREYRNEKEFFLANARYKLGDVVAVAQSYESIYDELWKIDKYEASRYAAISEKSGWRNKMFVKADLMPYQIRITGVRCERLQDISYKDCMREGIRHSCAESILGMYGYIDCEGTGLWFDNPRKAFASLINKVSGKGTWERNPFVVVYEFEMV